MNISTNDNESYDYNSIALNMVEFQIDFHFGDENLSMDNYLLSQMHNNKDYWVPLSVIANLSKIKSITDDASIILNACRKSQMVELNEDETHIRRPNFTPPMPKQHKDLRRTVLLFGIPPHFTQDNIIQLCENYGKVKSITMDSLNGTPDTNVCIQIMTKKFGPKAVRNNSFDFEHALTPIEKTEYIRQSQTVDGFKNPIDLTEALKARSTMNNNQPIFVHPTPNPNGNPLDFSHLKSCLVVFESQSQANKCNKHRNRISHEDGIKSMHQYDYNKFVKRLSMTKARGISALMSPQSIQLAVNSPSFAMMNSPQQSQSLFNNNNNNGMNAAAFNFYLSNNNNNRPNTAPHKAFRNSNSRNYKGGRRHTSKHYNTPNRSNVFDFNSNSDHLQQRRRHTYDNHNGNNNGNNNYNNNNNRQMYRARTTSHRYSYNKNNNNRNWNKHHRKQYDKNIPPAPSPNFGYNNNNQMYFTPNHQQQQQQRQQQQWYYSPNHFTDSNVANISAPIRVKNQFGTGILDRTK